MPAANANITGGRCARSAAAAGEARKVVSSALRPLEEFILGDTATRAIRAHRIRVGHRRAGPGTPRAGASRALNCAHAPFQPPIETRLRRS